MAQGASYTYTTSPVMQQPKVIYQAPAPAAYRPGQPIRQAIPGTAVPGTAVPVQAGTTIRPVAMGQAMPTTGTTVRTVVSTGPPMVAASGQNLMASLPPGTRIVRPVEGASSAQPRVVAQRPNTIGGPAYSQGAYEVKHEKDAQLQNLKELRKTSGLKQIPVDEGLKAFKNAAVESRLTREQFLQAYSILLEAKSIDMPSDEVKNAVFDLFDRDDNNIVDMMELICGISLLCHGSEDDKIHAVFGIFDENGDGYISLDEMYKFLTSVFKVVLTPVVVGAMNSMGVNVESAEDLASVTSLECFKTADLNQDGRLSVNEFKTWFYAPRNDPTFMFSPVRKLLQ